MSVLGFSLVGVLGLFAFGRLQQLLPLSIGMSALPSDGAWNTAVSFVTNTNWQWYSGEVSAGHLFQMSGLDRAELRLGRRRDGCRCRLRPRPGAYVGDGRVGNFWRDLVRVVYRLLLPAALVGAVLLVASVSCRTCTGPSS